MSTTITVAQKQAYHDNINLVFQMEGSVLRSLIRWDGEINGKNVFYDYVGKATAYERTTRHGDNQYDNVAHTRRMASAASYAWHELIDTADVARIVENPQSAYVRSGAYAIGRRLDTVIVTALNATAKTGETGSGTAGFPAGNIILSTFGDTVGVGLTTTKVRKTKVLMDIGLVPKDGRVFVHSPMALYDMLGDPYATDSDYAAVKALVNGEINTWLGFKWVMLAEGLPISGSTRSNFAFHGACVGGVMVNGGDIRTAVDVLPEKEHSTQVSAYGDFGAVRLQDGGVIEIRCTE